MITMTTTVATAAVRAMPNMQKTILLIYILTDHLVFCHFSLLKL